MASHRAQTRLTEWFALADIQINGDRPWDIAVHNDGFYRSVLSEGSLGFGESYMNGWWDCERLDELSFRVFRAGLQRRIKPSLRLWLAVLEAKLFNLQGKTRAGHDVRRHYNLGNDLYRAMLDKRMVYSCAYWKNAETLDQAQEDKLDLVCRKIALKPGMKVLDIGCGWGSFGKYAAEKYGVQVVGITVAGEQVKLAKELCGGYPVEIRLEDYRDVNEKFDRIVSLGMFEHVGYKNHRTYLETAHRCLNDDGLLLLHTIGGNSSIRRADPWVDKYIFPGAMSPSIAQIGRALEDLFVMEDWHNFGADYDRTLQAWWRNFDANWDTLKKTYGERFYRMWRFYLLGSQGVSRARDGQVWQIVLSKNGVLGGYSSMR